MSSFQDKHDTVLLESPWLTKDIDGETWLLKYAADPDRAGYVFLATDLKTIYFESLHAPSIPSRLSEIDSRSSKKGKHHFQSQGDIKAQSEEVLKCLVKSCGEEWVQVTISVRRDHFYDKIFELESGDFEWAFNVTELDLRRCVTLLSAHLVLPLAKGLASANDVKIPARASPATAIGKILADESIAAAFNPAGPSRAAKVGKSDASPKKHARQVENQKTPEESPVEEEEETQDYVSESEENAEPEVPETIPPPSAQKSPSTRKHKRRISSASAESPDEQAQAEVGNDAELKSPASQAEEEAPADEGEDGDEEGEDEVKVAETLPSQPKPSQKSKKEREKEEEEEVERRREEMKRKMEHGGGGRLGKRRLRR